MPIISSMYSSHPETILFRQFVGKIEKQDIYESWKQLIDNKIISEDLKGIVNNLNGCDFMINIDEFNFLLEFLNQHDNIKNLKIAVVTDSPQKIIFPMLGEKQEKELNIKPFSSNKAAEEWILSE